MNAMIVERTDRAFVRVHGRDPAKMVQGLITNDVARATPAQAVYAGMLSPKGRLVADLRVLRYRDDLVLECQVDALDNLLGNFKKFVPPLFARAEVIDRIQMSSVHGPDARAAITAALKDVPSQPEQITHTAGLLCIGSAYAGPDGFDLIGELPERASAGQQIVAAGARFESLAHLEVLRIEAGTPRWGAELDETVIPLEANLGASMISQTKGCYTGQEVIIRILHRGHVNRNLRGILLGQVDPPLKGAALLDRATGKPLGHITSSCVSPRFGQTIALGYVRREAVLPAVLALGTVDGPAATVVELPFEERS